MQNPPKRDHREDDAGNAWATYLSAPAGLPLPEHAGAVVERGEAVCTLLDRVSALLMADADPAASWRLALSHAAKAATRWAGSRSG